MNDLETAPRRKENVVGVFFTCVVCGTVEEINVPRKEGLPPKVYWECLTCQMRDIRDVRKEIALRRHRGSSAVVSAQKV